MNRKMFHKWKAGIGLTIFLTVLLSAVRAEVSVTTMIIRSFIAITGVLILSRVFLQVIATSEEMSRGQNEE
jgi:hypothetical protein